jgi:hypothetical protein
LQPLALARRQPAHKTPAPTGSRREPPIDLELPAIHSNADLLTALTAIADAVAADALTSSQSAALTRMLIALRQATW